MSDFVAFLLFGGALLLAVGMGEGLRAWAKWRPESSRRAVHSLAGLLVVFAVPLFSRPTWIYVLGVTFVGVNLIATRRGIFPGMHGIVRKSWGTVTFPLALIFALFTCWTLDPDRVYILQIAFLVPAISDPLASILGTRLKNPHSFVIAGNTKSVAGTAAFVASAFVLTTGGLLLMAPNSFGLEEILIAALIVALVAGAAEMLGGAGWDNLAIVVAVIVLLTAIQTHVSSPTALFGALLFAGAFGALSYKANFLALSGVVAASLLAFGIVGLGGLPWMLPGFTFFLLSSVLSTLGKRRKQQAEEIAEKTSRRDLGQVLANGGVAAMLLIAHVLMPHPELYWGFVGSFAAAAADTWGTEIGTFFRWPTRQIVTFRKVEPGESGGISVPGTLGAVLGATAVLMSAMLFATNFPIHADAWQIALLVIGAGFLASLFDSILGATLQGRYLDLDGRVTERRSENGRPHQLVQGFRWMTNHHVNLACTFVGALIPIAYLIVRTT